VPGRRGKSVTGGARETAPMPLLPPLTGRLPVPRTPVLTPEPELPIPSAKFSRAVIWCDWALARAGG
jgi:hypothetical protein